MISNRCARKSLVTNCNSIISKNYLRFLVDSNGHNYLFKVNYYVFMSLINLTAEIYELNFIPSNFCEYFSNKI